MGFLHAREYTVNRCVRAGDDVLYYCSLDVYEETSGGSLFAARGDLHLVGAWVIDG